MPDGPFFGKSGEKSGGDFPLVFGGKAPSTRRGKNQPLREKRDGGKRGAKKLNSEGKGGRQKGKKKERRPEIRKQ